MDDVAVQALQQIFRESLPSVRTAATRLMIVAVVGEIKNANSVRLRAAKNCSSVHRWLNCSERGNVSVGLCVPQCQLLFRIWSIDVTCSQSLLSVVFGRWPAVQNTAWCPLTYALQERSRRNRVKTLSDIAATYDGWANANQAAAEEILARLDSIPDETRDYKRWLADWLTAEAMELRARAAELRKA
jgi:hypothetical protein